MSWSQIILKILDENDNRPIITYPNSTDGVFRLTVSDQTLAEEFLLAVGSYDPDDGKNSELMYMMEEHGKWMAMLLSKITL